MSRCRSTCFSTPATYVGTGARHELLADLIENVGRPVDVLLLEGTHVRAPTPPASATRLSEKEVEDRCADLFRRTRALCSPCTHRRTSTG